MFLTCIFLRNVTMRVHLLLISFNHIINNIQLIKLQTTFNRINGERLLKTSEERFDSQPLLILTYRLQYHFVRNQFC